MSSSVLIVGAGPAGLCLALSLLRNGVSVRIIDKNTSYRVGRKGFGVQPRTIELHKLLGTLKDFEEYTSRFVFLQLYEGPEGTKVVKKQPLGAGHSPTVSCPWVNMCAFGQDRHEALFRSHIEKYGCSVELGTELVSFEQLEDRVFVHLRQTTADGQVTTEQSSFKWLIGADGARSIVRNVVGLSFAGETREGQDQVIGDIVVNNGLDPQNPLGHVWGNDKGMVTLLPSEVPESKVFTFIMSGIGTDRDKVVKNREEWMNYFQKYSGRKDIQFGDFIWISTWKPNIRMTDTFQKGRVFLIGDAAHCHTPAGGQGLNSGIQDAFNLGWKLALVERGLAHPCLLDTYSKERLPVVASLLRKSTMLYENMRSTGFTDGRRWERGSEYNQLGVNYRGSPIAVDEFNIQPHDPLVHDAYGTGVGAPQGADLRAGDRAPEAPGLLLEDGTSTSLYNLFGATYHTVLVFTKDLEIKIPLCRFLQKFSEELFRVVFILPKGFKPRETGVVTDSEGHAHAGYTSAGEERLVAVRPDGVVGAIVHGVEGLGTYLVKVGMIQ